MNKADMADRLVARTGLSKAVARDAVDEGFAAISDALADGDQVRITGFGTFGIRSRPARTRRNPRDRKGCILTGVDIADVQGRGDAEGCREGGSRVMTLQRQPTTSDRSNIEPSRLLCDDRHPASCPAGAGRSRAGRGVDGWPAAGLDAASRMWQRCHVPPVRTAPSPDSKSEGGRSTVHHGVQSSLSV